MALRPLPVVHLAGAESLSISVKDEEKQVSIHEVEDVLEVESSTYTINSDTERRLLWKLDLRIIPASMFLYFLCCIDRFNIGNAKILNSDTGDSLVQTLHLTDQQYLIALMVFFIAYALFETPENYLLKKYTPSRWLAFLMFMWGAMIMIIAACKSFAALVAMRFLLGVFEAGLFPGIVYCLTFWYKPNERAVRIALIVAYEMRALGAAGSFLICGVAFLVEALLPPTAFVARYAVLCVALPFAFAISAPCLSWLTGNLRNTGAITLAVPLNVSLATIGQIIGSFIYKSSESPAFPTGHYTNAGFMVAGAIGSIGLEEGERRKPKGGGAGPDRYMGTMASISFDDAAVDARDARSRSTSGPWAHPLNPAGVVPDGGFANGSCQDERGIAASDVGDQGRCFKRSQRGQGREVYGTPAF
ncbi:MFS general substrate transporter [Trametes sanguinea]|nr:MFS general substrate transporter [Trametes sanguinea]